MDILKQQIPSNSFGNLKKSAVLSLLIVLPFMFLEFVNGGYSLHGFPVPLFGFMWLLALSFIVLLVPILRSLQTGNRATPETIRLFLRLCLLILIAWMWTSLVLDQMPCFLGVPNCD